MQLTVGKVIWSVSIILVLLIMYNSKTYEKIENLFKDPGEIEIVQSYNPDPVREVEALPQPGPLPSDATEDVATESPGPEPEDYISDDHFGMMMEIEKLKWDIQNLKEKITEATARNIAKDNDNTIGDMTTILIALLPVLLPYVTKKYNNKEIFKKG